MNVQEWALIAFTILAQMSVGSFWVLGIVHFYAMRKAGEEEADRLSDRALLVIGPLLVLGLIASLFHLGDPFNAFRAVANLDSSWLSREILSGVIFAILGGLFAIMQWRKIGSFATRNVIALIAALVGLFLVLSMANVYMLPTQPAWDTLATPILFFTTTFLLGALAMGAAFAANYLYLKRRNDPHLEVQRNLIRGSLGGITLAAVILLGVQLVTIPIFIATLSGSGPAAQASVEMLVTDYVGAFSLYLVLSFLGAGVLGVVLLRDVLTGAPARTLAWMSYAVFGVVLVAQVLGRYLFYAMQVPLGI